ncbi:MAG TPA: phosphatase PAP2 family protein [Rhizomicrobium sp.]|jgi:acid phosphatase (class A)
MNKSLAFAALLLVSAATAASGAVLDPVQVDAAHLVPPPPPAGSAQAEAELAEIHAIHARSSDSEIEAARKDSDDEKPDMFNNVIGFDLTMRPLTTALLKTVIDEEEAATKGAKKYFHRDRPWIVDGTVATCTLVPPGPAANSYPSGHSTVGFAMGVVLANLMPEKSQAILARSSEFAEHRLVCGVHFRSDIVAGQQYGTILALTLMQNPDFQLRMAKAREELRAAR